MNSKIIVAIFSILLSINSFAQATGVYLNGTLVDSADAGQKLLNAYVELGSDADACYESTFEEAIEAVNLAMGDEFTLDVYDVYGETEYPTLDIEISNKAGDYASGLLSACH